MIINNHVARQIGAVDGLAKATLARDLRPAIERALARHQEQEEAC